MNGHKEVSRNGVNGQTRDGENGQTPDEENDQSHDEENGQTRDRENGQTRDRENGQTPDGENGQTPDGENGQTPDGENGQTPDGENGQTPDEENGQSRSRESGRTHDKENVQSCDGENGQTPDGENGQTPDEENDQSHDEENGQTRDRENGQTPDGENGQTPDGENGQTPDEENGQSRSRESGRTHDKENVQSCDEENSQSHDEENGLSDDEEAAEKLKCLFLAKLKLGLRKLKEVPKSTEIKDLGPQLALYAANTEKDDGKLVEKLLEAAKKVPASIGWQLSFHRLFVLYRRRKFEPRHLETGSQGREKPLKKKESLCEFLGCIVNQLESKWGICASLVFNILEETKFKASMLRDMRRTARIRAANLITDELLKIDQIVLWQGTQVLNPVFFISSVMGIPPYIAFENIGIGNLSKYDIQKPIECNQKHLSELGLYCGKIHLCTLLQVGSFKERQAPKSNGNLITINLYASVFYTLEAAN
ncbi:unnamed protein product [Clonostachys solani]|uniref:Uncharacterized protein n=1 Tax=Clonostachys solani TaxID=160281 RepID=A0A9P0EKK1_9HYPO|nr:unnamed protein product [Clonostachys solani]